LANGIQEHSVDYSRKPKKHHKKEQNCRNVGGKHNNPPDADKSPPNGL